MKKIVLLAVLISLCYQFWPALSDRFMTGSDVEDGVELLYDTPYIVVYGEDRCQLTQTCMSDLDIQGIDYIYKQLSKPGMPNELFPRMEKSGLSINRILLPILDINGKIMVRPEVTEILDAYNEGQDT